MFEYAKRLSEVDVIIKLLPEEDYNKIPKDLIKMIDDNKDNDYLWEYDERKKLHEQGLNRNTIAILSYINMNYLLNEEQKKCLEEIHENNQRRATKRLENKTTSGDMIFNTSKTEKKELNYEVKDLSVETIKISFWKRCMIKLKSILH